jgi:phosphoribosylanthranilate isomerase
MKPLLKICGMNNIEILNELLSIDKINFLGFIFYKTSIRNFSEEFLKQIKACNFENKRPVCVYVDSNRNFIEETSLYFKDPILQFHGNETNQFCNSFKKEFWKVLRIKNAINIEDINNFQDASGILLENFEEGKPGGTGITFDWSLVNSVKHLDMKFILSGGINCKNVDNAINIKPWCVDINSGVESSPGIKSLDLVKEVIEKF